MSRVEALTSQFYAWERRCRGWDLYDYPVELEPTFTPFFFHEVPTTPTIIDDGLRPTLFNNLVKAVKTAFIPEEKNVSEVSKEKLLDPYPYSNNDEGLVAYSVSFPKDRKIRPDETEQFLLMLSQSQYLLSFEIIGTYNSIRVQFTCSESDGSRVHDLTKAYFPDAIINEVDPDEIVVADKEGMSINFGLGEEFMRPLKTVKNYDLDPHIGIFSVLENLAKDEQAAIQILFKSAINPWAESIIRSVLDNGGNAFFIDAPEMVKMAEEKISAPLFGVAIRVIGQDSKGTGEVAKRLAHAVMQSARSQGNELIPLESYPQYAHDVLYRTSHRLGMLLNSKELATFVHFPSVSVVSNKLERDTKKTKAASEIYEGQKHILGINVHQGIEREVTISSQQRLKHTHIIGATGTGKSMLLLTSIIQDIINGEGVAVLDPHGDLIDLILSWMHPDRRKDVILIDPADSEFPVGFNILTAHSEIEKDILSSDLVAVFRRLSTSWGDQMNSVFANAILAFLESNKGGTLIDLRRFLIEKSFRDQFLKTVTDPSIVYYWQKEYPILKSGSIGPILTRLDSFLRPKLIRNMVAQNKSLDFEDILDSKKILLIKLSQGLIGTENSYLLGTFIVSKIQQAAMARQAKQKADRSDFYLYIDEFQNFITPSMTAILSGARKYHLGLILAHQDMMQLHKEDSELESSVMANAGTRICFRLGDADARKFEGGFSYFEAMDLQNLQTGEAIIRIERPENDCNMTTIPVGEMDAETAHLNKEMTVEASRNTCGTPKADVEALLRGIQEVEEEPIQDEQPIKPPPKIQEGIPEQIQLLKEVQQQTSPASQEEKKQETQHRYLQTLIKKMAESRGYKAVIEEQTGDGGRVDVGLLKDNSKIAVEISVTTPDTWEIQNIQKCLTAGYTPVIICSQDRKHLEKIRKFVEATLDITAQTNVLFFEPDALFLYLDQQTAKELNKEERVKGYRVKVEYNAMPEEVSQAKRNDILKNVSESIKKNRKK